MKIRDAFESAPGMLLVEADYSQMEVACLAALSRDPVLIGEVADGVDMHVNNAARWLKCAPEEVPKSKRKTAKIMTFQMAYGATAGRIAIDFGLSEKETQAFIDAFCEKYPSVPAWWDATHARVSRSVTAHPVPGKAHVDRWSVLSTPYGKRYTFMATDERRDYRTGKSKMSVGARFTKNYPVQGLAADILKMAQASLWASRGSLVDRGVVPCIQIHDAIYFNVPEEALNAEFVTFLELHMVHAPVQTINRIAGEDYWPTGLPLRIELKVGTRWSEMTEYTTV